MVCSRFAALLHWQNQGAAAAPLLFQQSFYEERRALNSRSSKCRAWTNTTMTCTQAALFREPCCSALCSCVGSLLRLFHACEEYTISDQACVLSPLTAEVRSHRVPAARSSGPVSSYAYQRLRLLQTKFELYTMATWLIMSLSAVGVLFQTLLVRSSGTRKLRTAAVGCRSSSGQVLVRSTQVELGSC